jgi:hypothetical protein
MNYALVRRTVTDVAKWRAAYAEYAPKRAEAGLTDTMVLYSVDKPNEVWTFTWCAGFSGAAQIHCNDTTCNAADRAAG